MRQTRTHSRAGSDRPPPPYVPFGNEDPDHSQGSGNVRYSDGRTNQSVQGEQQPFFSYNPNYGTSYPQNANFSHQAYDGWRSTPGYIPVNHAQPQVPALKTQISLTLRSLVAFLLGSGLVFFLFGYLANVPLNSALHERQRRLWGEEEHYRAITRSAWAEEVKKHQELQSRMQEEQKMFDEMRLEWTREQEEERAERERRKQQAEEEEARKRDSLAWEGLQAGHCVRYGVKEYTATLSRVPLGLDSVEECQKKSINIQGHDWLPTRCEESGFCGRVTAHFDVDINESSCKPWWVNYRDKGCVEYGVRRHEASIEDLHDTENWESICMTTPMTIGGHYYDGPTSCANWGRGGLWPWGIWLVDDDSCRW